jgi:hypothetical protein
MAVRHVDFPREFDGWPTREAWIQWAERMGLDPMRVVVPGWIEADDDARTVTALCNIPSPDGRGTLYDRETMTLTHVELVLQLESPALPFPEAY